MKAETASPAGPNAIAAVTAEERSALRKASAPPHTPSRGQGHEEQERSNRRHGASWPHADMVRPPSAPNHPG